MDDPVGEFKTWFRSLPRFSRTFLAASFIIAAILSLRFMSIYAFTLDIESIVYRLNVHPFPNCRSGGCSHAWYAWEPSPSTGCSAHTSLTSQ